MSEVPFTNDPTEEADAIEVVTNKKKVRLIIIICALLVIVAIVVVAIVLSSGKSDGKKSDDKTPDKPEPVDPEPVEPDKNYITLEYNIINAGKIKLYDDYKPGQVFSSNIESLTINDTQYNATPMFQFNNTGVHTVVMKFSKKISRIDSLFFRCENLIKADFSNFDTSNLESMYGLFYYANSLKTVIFGNNFKTKNVVSMSLLFYKCNSLTSIDLSKFDTSNVKSFSGMFNGCSSLSSLDLSNFNTSSLKNAEEMFNDCSGLEVINEKFSSENLESVNYMFKNCKKLKSLDLSGLKGENLTSISGMFYNCVELSSLDLSNFDGSLVKEKNDVFYGLPSSGAIKYNSGKITSDILSLLPNGWEKVDVKEQN